MHIVINTSLNTMLIPTLAEKYPTLSYIQPLGLIAAMQMGNKLLLQRSSSRAQGLFNPPTTNLGASEAAWAEGMSPGLHARGGPVF